MHDLDLNPFETRVARRLQAYASIEVRPANPRAIARETMATRRRAGLGEAWASMRAPMRLAVVVALAAALLVGAWFVGARLRVPSLVVAPTPSAGPPRLAANLRAEWLADVQGFAALGLPSARQRLVAGEDGASIHLVTEGGVELLTSRVRETKPGELTIATESPGLGCRSGDLGSYRLSLSPDESTVTISLIADACANRGQILARAWWRSFDRQSAGGRGLVAAFEPGFLITLPAGRYTNRVYTDAFEAVGDSNGLALYAGKDPWGLSDPCSASGGNPLPVAPGVDAFVAYIRTLPGFTVATTELQIDGNRAAHLSITTTSGIDCPGGVVIEWIAKADAPGGVTWHLTPGDPDSMYVVETPTATYLFQYLGSNVTTADEVSVLSSIHLVESLAVAP